MRNDYIECKDRRRARDFKYIYINSRYVYIIFLFDLPAVVQLGLEGGIVLVEGHPLGAALAFVREDPGRVSELHHPGKPDIVEVANLI